MAIRSHSIIKFIVFTLILGIFTVPNEAIAVDTITKTFTVRGADNALLTGAQVLLSWDDQVTGASVIGTPASTNSAGVVSLTAPVNARYLTYTVFPPSGDRRNALQGDTEISSAANGTVNVKLELANFFVNVQKSDGTNVSGGAVILWPSISTENWNRTAMTGPMKGSSIVIRSGSVGLKLPSDLNTNSDYAIRVVQDSDNYQPGQFSWAYGLRASGTAGSQSYTMFTDANFSGTTIAPIDSTYVLKYSAANIIGTLKNNDGSTFNMTSGMTLQTVLRATFSAPTFPQSGSTDYTDAVKSPTGNWFARGLGGAGEYQLIFTFGGSSTIASFQTAIYKNSAGGWSLNQAGPFVGDAATPAQIEVRRPATSPNFAFEVKAGDTQQAMSIFLNIAQRNQDSTWTTLSAPKLLNGKFAGIIPNGVYNLNLQPTDSNYVTKNYNFTVTNNAISSFTDSANNNVTPTNGVYLFSIPAPNLVGTIKDSSGNDLVFGQNQGVSLNIQKKVNGGWQWQDGGSYTSAATYKLNIDDTGEFRIVARPNGFTGLSESYSSTFFIAAGTPKKFSTVDAASAAAGNTTSLSGVNITMRTANLKMSITDPRDNSLLKYGWVSVLQKSANGDQTWVGNADIQQNAPGIADIRLDDGNYRLELNPQYNGTMLSGLARKYYDVTVSGSGATVTVLNNNVAISPDSSGRYGLTPAAANITGKITDQAGIALSGNNSSWVSINVQKYVESRKEFDWSSNWSNTDQNGDFSISVTDPGKYRLRIQPTGYANASIFYSQEFTLATGSEKFNFGSMKSPAPSLKGIVYTSNGSTPLRDARVRVINSVNNQELWQYEANTSSTGSWSMNLPAGSYQIYAVPPYGSSAYGNSDKIGTVTVDSSGVAALSGDAQSGRTAATFNLSLKAPTWSGVVKNPAGDAVVQYATVCLLNNNIWNCTDADANGAWALSAPTGFTSFASDARVEISDNRGKVYPRRQFSDMTAALGGTSGNNRILQFQASNVAITVTGNNNAAVQDVWVSLTRQNAGWLGGNNTNASGVALIYVDDLTKPLEVRIEIGGNSPASGVYAPQVVTFTGSQVSNNASGNSNVFRTTVQLTAPNLTAIVREPNATWANGAVVANAWTELFDATTNAFISNSNSGPDGKIAINAPKPSNGTIQYILNVNPAFNSTSSFSKQSYTVTVDSSNGVTMTPKGSQTAVATNNGIFSLALANPNVSGSVVDPSNVGVANSWVVPISATTGEYYWQYGSNTKSTGTFGMNLPNDTYKIDANLPWNSTGVAKPAQCTVTVAGGVITSSASDCVIVGSNNQKTVKLAMRTPNVTFTLKQNNALISGVNVSLGVGKWNTNAQSNSSGVVSLFIDPVEIASKSGLSGTQDIHVWVDPPWGTSSMVRWDCNSGDAKEICRDLADINLSASSYAPVSNPNVVLPGPNSRMLIKDPRTNQSIGVNAWVSLLAYDTALPQNGTRWIAGSNSDTDGYVSFNIETITATTRFKVEVNPPWNQRVGLTQKVWDNSGNGYTDAQLKAANLEFSAGTPNAVVTVKLPGGVTDNKSGWIGIQEVNPANNNFVAWVGGYGLNDTGTASITLAANKRYRITANPANGKAGAQTSCLISTDGNIAISKVQGSCDAGSIQSNTNNLTMTMVAGNVAGFVKFNNVGIANATVYAKLVGSTDDDSSIISATLADGSFGFDLDFSGGKQWVIKVFPFNVTGETALANQTLATLSGPNANLTVTLAVR